MRTTGPSITRQIFGDGNAADAWGDPRIRRATDAAIGRLVVVCYRSMSIDLGEQRPSAGHAISTAAGSSRPSDMLPAT
jgi:hypothetical protein